MLGVYSNKRLYNFNDMYPAMYGDHLGAKTVTFIVTHSCNLRCSYCYEHNKSDGRMSIETAHACVDYLFQMDKENHPYVNFENSNALILDFIGGEPLLEIDLIRDTVNCFRSRAIELDHRWATQYMISMSTNGVCYDDPKVKQFLEENAGRVSMSVTLDGDKETHDRCRVDCSGCGSYDRASAAFFEAKNRYGQSGTKFTIAPANVDRTFLACRDMIEKFDLTSLHCNCVYEEGWNNQLAQTLYYELQKLADWVIDTNRYQKVMLSIFEPSIGQSLTDRDDQNWCGGTGQMLSFDIDGTMYPCLRYAPLSIGNRAPLRIGDLEHGIGSLHSDKETLKLLNSITRTSQSPEKCLACPIASGCGWCSAYNYEVYGTPNKRATFICCTHKARVMAASYYWNRIYRILSSKERFKLNIPREWAVEIVPEREYEALLELST